MQRRFCALALALAAVTGCANHVRFSEEIRDTEARVVTRSAARIESRERVIAQPFAELTVSVDEVAETRRRESLVRLDEETPWRARNELWEVPAGLGAVPLFIVIRASDKLFLGLIPDDFISEGTDWGFTALNPALNLESSDRVRRREIGRSSRDFDGPEERAIRPLPDAALSLSLGEGPSQSVTSDGAGRASVELLSLLPSVPARPPRVLHVEVAGDGAREPAVLELSLSRQLGARLQRAAQARETARKPGAAPDRVAQALVLLDSLGFPESALALERELRERQHANAAWLARLDLALEDP
jgi:hypothetical protein